MKKYYVVVSKIRTLTYRKLAILPIKLDKVYQGLETEPFVFRIIVFSPLVFSIDKFFDVLRLKLCPSLHDKKKHTSFLKDTGEIQ
jgi:hypothetical protein